MIVVVGCSGYIGTRITSALRSQEWDVRGLSRRECDYYDVKKLGDALSGAQFLINAAGFTGSPNVDACEDRKAECLLGNAVLPGIIREACEAADVPWIHVSSGCIYSGTSADANGFKETDSPNFSFRTNNCSFYSGTKTLGEEVLAGASKCYVLRLRIPFESADNSRNYLSKLLRYERLLDARNSLTYLGDFVASCIYCLDERPKYGVYNVTNTGSVSTREVVDLIKQHKVSKKTFQFFDSEEQFMRLAAKTPRSNCVMDNRKAISAGFPLMGIHAALDRVLECWNGSKTKAV